MQNKQGISNKNIVKAGRTETVFQLLFIYLASVPADGILFVGRGNNQH